MNSFTRRMVLGAAAVAMAFAAMPATTPPALAQAGWVAAEAETMLVEPGSEDKEPAKALK